METIDSFYTIQSETSDEIKIKGSKFISRIFFSRSEDQAEEILNQLRKKYFDASHHCFAYRVGTGTEIKFRYSDDGEPSGTAGKPIYDRILGNDLTNLLIVVTRYYGGTKLGTGGLTHAYSESAGNAINKAGMVKKFITQKIKIITQFSFYNSIERLINQYNAKVVESYFTDIVTLDIKLRLSDIESFKKKLIDITSGGVKIEPSS